MKYTLEKIASLKPNEVFVFGSNLQGWHGGGAARVAILQFGAEYGNPVGLQGQSYAIPTKDLSLPFNKQMRSVSLEDIEKSIVEFYHFASQNQQLVFYMTKIGCNLAGYSVAEMNEIFCKMPKLVNVILPIEFTDAATNFFNKQKEITHVLTIVNGRIVDSTVEDINNDRVICYNDLVGYVTVGLVDIYAYAYISLSPEEGNTVVNNVPYQFLNTELRK